MHFIVCVDGSQDSKNAFNFAVGRLLDQKDSLLTIMNVADRINPAIYAHAYVTTAFITEAQAKLNAQAKRLLREYGHLATVAGVNHKLVMSTSDNPAEMVVLAAKEKGCDAVVVGRRGMGKLKRFFIGSTSKYILEHAPCDVIVVKGEYDLPEEHDVTVEEIKRAEEVERQERIREDEEQKRLEEEKAKFQSQLDRNVVVMAEEAERRRRLEEEKMTDEQLEKDREAALIGVIVEEEEERKRRMEEFPEYDVEHFGGLLKEIAAHKK